MVDTVLSYGSEVCAPGLLDSEESCDSVLRAFALGFPAAPPRCED